jgi:ribosomal protein S18 acetylase RimI-like enzyme
VTAKLRKPYNEESDDCVKLLYISGPSLFSYLYIEKEPEIYALFKKFFDKPGTTFSKENIIVEEESGTIRGLILAHPVSHLQQYLLNELKCIGEMKRGLFHFLVTLVKMLIRVKLAIHYPRLENNEFFICNLAVFKEYRRRGIARKLLNRIEEIAIEKGFHNLSLYVETDNHHAKRVYEKFGFQEVKKAVFPKKYNKHGLFGFYKMVKKIR